MVGESVKHYEGKNINLEALKNAILQHLEQEGFQVQASAESPHGNVIQAKKGNWLSALIAADRALTILIDGEPNNFLVRVGIGKWLEHLGVTAVEGLLISPLFILVDVPETLWNFEIEGKILREIDTMVGQMPVAA